MVILVFVLDIIEDLDRFFRRGGIHHHHLETTSKCPILFDVLSVFVQGGGSDALDFATCQGRLEHVGRIQRS